MNDTAQPLLRLQGITKRFGPVTVLRGIDLALPAGEVHALVGENGAGKSTLMHILAGVHTPEEGRIDFNGFDDVKIRSAHHAQELGIATVFQERSLFPHLSVAENIFAGRQPVAAGRRIDRKKLADDARGLLRQVGLAVEPDELVGDLSPDQQQMVEIAKALSLDARLVIFDEPTAALTLRETDALFRVIRVLQSRGIAVIYISHRLEEIFQVAQRVTVLRDGVLQGTKSVGETTPDELVRMMVGRALVHQLRDASARPTSGAIRLEVQGLADPAHRRGQRTCLHDISFHVCAGEIVGLAGLAGAGRTETALSIIGARERGSGEILLDGSAVPIASPADAIAAGIGYLSEDRKADGIFADMSLTENTVVAGLAKFGSWWLDHASQRQATEQTFQRLRVVCDRVEQPIVQLSGGNQQKCLLARWLLLNPRVLIVDEPTRGVDVGAKAEVHALLRELAAQGTAVLVISSDLPEVLAVSDRILVMRQGRLVGELPGATATETDVMRLASLEIAPTPAA